MRKPRKFAGRLALLTGAGVLGGLAIAGPSAAAEFQAAKASSYVANGTILGQNIITLFDSQADENTATDSSGLVDSALGPITLSALESKANVDTAAGTASASADVASASLRLGNFAGFSLSLEINTISAKCAINPDGTTSASTNPPIITLRASSPVPGLSANIPVDLIDGQATLGFSGFNLGTITLGAVDNDYSDGVVSAEGLKVTLLNVGGMQGGSVTFGHAECGPVTLVNDVPVADPAVLGAVGALGLLGFGGYRVAARRSAA